METKCFKHCHLCAVMSQELMGFVEAMKEMLASEHGQDSRLEASVIPFLLIAKMPTR